MNMSYGNIPLSALLIDLSCLKLFLTQQSGTKPNLVAKILATKFGFVPDCSEPYMTPHPHPNHHQQGVDI